MPAFTTRLRLSTPEPRRRLPGTCQRLGAGLPQTLPNARLVAVMVALAVALPLATPRAAQAAQPAPAAGSTVAAADAPATRISSDEARRDLRTLKRAFTELHPGLYRYATVAEIDTAFADAEAEVRQGATRGQMFLIASRLAAVVRCGHTWAGPYNQPPAVAKEVFERADKLPLALRLVAGRLLVIASAVPGVVAGAELLAVDGRPAAEILQGLLPYLRADGRSDGSDAKRLSQLDHGPNGGAMDRLLPLRFPATASAWRLTVRDAGSAPPRDIVAATMSVAERNRALGAAAPPSPSAAWTLAIDGDTAVLTLPTFAFWGGGFDARGFLQRSFDELRSKQVPRLIIDIRNSEGGDDTLGNAVLAQLLKTAYTVPASRIESAYERVPYDLARYLDTWDFGFFDRTGKVVRGPARNWQLPDKPAFTTQPVAQPYGGSVALLVGPRNSSAGFLLARDMQRSAAAALIGQPTGGNLRGLNSGQLAWINLPASGVAVDIPLLAAFTPGDEPDRGVIPDIVVAPRWDDAAAGIDTEMAAARRWLASGAARPR